MRSPCLACALLVACGAPSREPVDGADGDAAAVDADLTPTSIGTVAGEPLTPTVWYFAQTGGFDQILLKEGGVACQPGAAGHAVRIMFPCGPVAVGTHPLVNGTTCTSPRATLNITGFPFPYTELYAQQGSVEITAIAPTVQGSFTATQFYNPTDLVSAPGAIAGAFDVTICP